MSEKLHFEAFVEQVALESGFDYDTAHAYVEAMFETIVEESTKGKPVKVRNFGSFQPREYKAKRGINPQTGQPLDILPHYHIHYAVAKGLEETLNGGEKRTSISLDESPNLVGKIIIVTLIAILIGLIYRSFFMTQMPAPKLPPKQTLAPAKEAIVPQSITKEAEALPKEKEAVPVVTEQVKEVEVVTEKTIEEPVAEIIEKKAVKPELPSRYKVTKAETLSQISKELYGSSIYWPLLYQNNRTNIKSPDLILQGSRLYVPEKSEKNLKKAYLSAYRSYLKADKMSASFWTLCSGAHYMGQKFISYLSKNIDKSDLKVVKKCAKK